MNKLYQTSSMDELPLFLEITTVLNNQVLEKIPGCEQFLHNTTEHVQYLNKQSDERWLFKGTLYDLIELHNSFKSIVKKASQGFISYQIFLDSFDDTKDSNSFLYHFKENNKDVRCDLMLPYTTNGRFSRLHHKLALTGSVHLSESRTKLDSKNEKFGNTLENLNINQSEDDLEIIVSEINEKNDGSIDSIENCTEGINEHLNEDQTIIDQNDIFNTVIDTEDNVVNLVVTREEVDSPVIDEENLVNPVMDTKQDETNSVSETYIRCLGLRSRSKQLEDKQGVLCNKRSRDKRKTLLLKKDSSSSDVACKKQRKGRKQKCPVPTSQKRVRKKKINTSLETNETPKFNCSECSFNCQGSNEFVKHMRCHNKSNDESQFKCILCPFVSNTENGLSRHLYVHVKNEKDTKQIDKSYTCDHCNKTFKMSLHLNRHIKDLHSPELRPHVCDKCGKGFKRSDALQQHQYVHLDRNSRQLPWKCPDCDKGFRSKAHLKEHLPMHSDERPFLCHYCGMSFKTYAVQKQHIATKHTEGNSHVCSKCGSQFKAKQSLQRHELTHRYGKSRSEKAAKIKEALSKIEKMGSADKDVLDMSQRVTIIDCGGVSKIKSKQQTGSKQFEAQPHTSERITVTDNVHPLQSVPPTTFTILNFQPSTCDVQDINGKTTIHSGQDNIYQYNEALQMNYVQDNQSNTAVYHFPEIYQVLSHPVLN